MIRYQDWRISRILQVSGINNNEQTDGDALWVKKTINKNASQPNTYASIINRERKKRQHRQRIKGFLITHGQTMIVIVLNNFNGEMLSRK